MDAQALKREHSALQNMKLLYFFLCLWVIFALLDPDPDPATQINAESCGSGSGSTTLVEICRDPVIFVRVKLCPAAREAQSERE
jgi:hypothetical protein